MDREIFEIRGRVFRTKADYARAWHDNRIIVQIEKTLDKKNKAQIEELKEALDCGKYNFESILGEDFIEEIEELWAKLSVSYAASDKGVGLLKNMGDKGKSLLKRGDKNNSTKEAKSLEDFDAEMQQRIIAEMKRNQRRRILMLAVLGLCIVGSVGYLIFYYALYQKNDMEYNSLAALVKEDAGGTVKINYEEAKDMPPILKKYETLYQKNKKIVGWLKIDGCGIDYPVMQTTDNEYYLDHNYNQEYDKNGSLFMDKDCNAAFPTDNTIIYGHHMKSGKMFGKLNYYSKKSFWEENPTFTFDSIYEAGTYEVMYVFRSRIYSEEEIVFKYYQFLKSSSGDEFYSNMESMAELSLYDTGVTASYGDRLLTLSTCDSSEEDGRFVVVARKIN